MVFILRAPSYSIPSMRTTSDDNCILFIRDVYFDVVTFVAPSFVVYARAWQDSESGKHRFFYKDRQRQLHFASWYGSWVFPATLQLLVVDPWVERHVGCFLCWFMHRSVVFYFVV